MVINIGEIVESHIYIILCLGHLVSLTNLWREKNAMRGWVGPRACPRVFHSVRECLRVFGGIGDHSRVPESVGDC